VIELGPSKVKVSRMAIGTGTMGGGRNSNQLRKLGVEGVADMLVNAYENGVFTWDTSDSYGTHAAIKVALKKVPREKVTILTKSPAVNATNLKADLDRFLRELGTDYVDIVLLHSRLSPKWEELDKPLMDVLSEAKQKKIVRTLGISIHSLEAMKVAAKSSWLEVCMTRINPAGIRMDAPTDAVLPVMAELKAAGKGIIGMKIFGEGQLKDRRDEALLFALNKSPAHSFTIGCESREEFQDNIARIEKLSQQAV
ncbi:MAG TPA: aldo/keto reductase, partial [Tepidisphaeraceae bacterium]|nr:aldo/keto reductase [Tepidisphaeraceae bacterium]